MWGRLRRRRLNEFRQFPEPEGGVVKVRAVRTHAGAPVQAFGPTGLDPLELVIYPSWMDRSKPLNVHEAKAQFSELLDRAHAGQEIVVSKKGKPWAKIVPIGRAKKRELGFGIGVVDETFFEPLPEVELAAWEAGTSRVAKVGKRVTSSSRALRSGGSRK